MELILDFDGVDYDPELDRERLTGQHYIQFEIMQDGGWYTLQDIEDLTGQPQASISARMRDFRKKKFGSHIVNRKRVGDTKRGLYAYQLIVNPNPTKMEQKEKAEKEKEKMPIERALKISQRFLAIITPHLLKVELAGSIRRECKEVGDIEFVCIEDPSNPLSNLFPPDYPGLTVNGPRLKRFCYPKDKVQIELYITMPYDYGRILAIRTGSAWYSHCQLATNWNRLGWCGTENGLRRKKECEKKGSVWKLLPEYKEKPTMPPEFKTEADFYEFLGVPWIAPRERNWSDPTKDKKYNYSK